MERAVVQNRVEPEQWIKIVLTVKHKRNQTTAL